MDIKEKVGSYITSHEDKRSILESLRSIILTTELEETIKWGVPVYTLNAKNIVGIAAFKAYAALWFYQGALLADKANRLINAQEGKTQALRQWRFTSMEEIDEQEVRSYVEEAIQNQKEGREVKLNKPKAIPIPEIFNEKLKSNETFNSAFQKLSTAKQREYLAYIEEAKRKETKLKRLEKIVPMILSGKGLNDQYK